MFTLEQKVDLIMRYIATTNPTERSKLKKGVIEALQDDTAGAAAVVADNRAESERIIDEFLRKVGMPPHLSGYNYCVLAIQLCAADPSYLREITKRLYVDIASEFNTTPSRVERAIRHAVEMVFDRGDLDYIFEIFGNTMSTKRGKLTNSEFIAASSREIALQLKEK